MANVFIENATLQNIANAIRNKTGKTEKILPAEMPAEIESIETGGGDNYYDTFWDNYQDYGNRTDYQYAFSYGGWNDKTFNPKYNMKVLNATSMFYTSQVTEINKTLDLSECTNCGTMFAYSMVLTVKDMLVNENLDFSNAFRACYGLTTLGIRGTIGKTITVQWSNRLSSESVDNIINCLKDLTGQTTQMIAFHATVGAELTDTQKATITAKNWTLVY